MTPDVAERLQPLMPYIRLRYEVRSVCWLRDVPVRTAHTDAGQHSRRVLGEEELETVGRAGDVDPAEPHGPILRGLQAFDALVEADGGDAPLSTVSLSSGIDGGEMICRGRTGRDGELRPSLERGPTRPVSFAWACEQSDELMALHSATVRRAAGSVDGPGDNLSDYWRGHGRTSRDVCRLFRRSSILPVRVGGP